MLCSVFAWINCPYILYISSAKLELWVEQWTRKQMNNMHRIEYLWAPLFSDTLLFFTVVLLSDKP